MLPPSPLQILAVNIPFLASLVARGSCLICEVCIGPGEGCTGLAHHCSPNEDACLTMVGENSFGDGETTETLKTCIAADNCYAGSISFTTDAGVHMRSASTCCQDSFCNQRELNLPPVNLLPNGLRCPACFAFGSDLCEGNETLVCTGDDHHCITVSGMLNTGGLRSTFMAKGCSAEAVCSLPLGIGLYSPGMVFTLNRIMCSPAPNVNSDRAKLADRRKP